MPYQWHSTNGKRSTCDLLNINGAFLDKYYVLQSIIHSWLFSIFIKATHSQNWYQYPFWDGRNVISMRKENVSIQFPTNSTHFRPSHKLGHLPSCFANIWPSSQRLTHTHRNLTKMDAYSNKYECHTTCSTTNLICGADWLYFHVLFSIFSRDFRFFPFFPFFFSGVVIDLLFTR